MNFQLVEIVTKDNLVHQGIYSAPAKPGHKAILWVHGLTSKFYGDVNLMNLFAAFCNTHRMGFASFNNRGHDYLTGAHRLDPKNKKGYTYETIGSSLETFTECIQDINAAITFLFEKGYKQVVLVGHSSGANKVCYYAGKVQDKRVMGIVLAGPLSDRYGAEQDIQVYKRHQEIVEEKIQQGKGEELVAGLEYFPLTPYRWLSLNKKMSKEDVFNYRDPTGALSTFSNIRLPLLVIFSGNDEHADRSIEEIRKAFDDHAGATNYKSIIIADTGHNVTGKEKEFVGTVITWVQSL